MFILLFGLLGLDKRLLWDMDSQFSWASYSHQHRGTFIPTNKCDTSTSIICHDDYSLIGGLEAYYLTKNNFGSHYFSFLWYHIN